MKPSQSPLSKAEMEKLFYPTPAIRTKQVLRDNPDLSFLRHLNYSEEKFRPSINAEITARWIKLNGGENRDRIVNEGGHRKITQQVQQKYIDHHIVQRARTLLWVLSERYLNVLRTKGLTPTPTAESTDQAMLRFITALDVARFPEIDETRPPLGPNEYFELAQPQLVAVWGYPFYSTVIEQLDVAEGWGQQDAKRAEEKIIGVNTDFWGAFLGGDKRLGHDCVFVMAESRFYYFDPVVSCYMPTTEEKMRLGLSQALQQRAWGQEASSATMILETFRSKKVFDEIITKAKAILAAEEGFFTGTPARPKWGGVQKAHELQVIVDTFVKEQVEQVDGGIMPLGDILLQLGRTPRLSVGRKALTQTVNEAVRATFNRGLRNDLRLEDNRVVVGWKGLRLRGVDALNAVIRDSGRSEASEVDSTEQTMELGLMS